MAFRIKKTTSIVESHCLRDDRIIVSAAGSHAESNYISLAIEDDDGYVGFGEAAVSPLWSGETAKGAKDLIDTVFTPLLLNVSLDHPRDANFVLDQAIVGNPFAKSAVDVAFWDLWGKRVGCSAWRLFADREPGESVPTRASIGAYSVERTRRLARDLHAEGIRTLKFKVGVPGIDDVSRLRGVREEMGDNVIFTVDYNGAFTDAAVAIKHIEQLLPFGISLIEQPTHRDRISLMAEVRREIGVPIVMDEGVFTRLQLDEAIALDAFDILSIYPGKNGGVTAALDMAETAVKAGKRCAIGSNLETDLGQAAMLALSACHSAFPNEEIHGDLMSPLYYAAPSVTEPLRFADGRVFLPAGDGFGVTPKCFAEASSEAGHNYNQRQAN